VKDGAMHEDFPDILHGVHTDIENMYDSDPTTIFAGQKSRRDSDDPMKQYRRIPFHFQVRPILIFAQGIFVHVFLVGLITPIHLIA